MVEVALASGILLHWVNSLRDCKTQHIPDARFLGDAALLAFRARCIRAREDEDEEFFMLMVLRTAHCESNCSQQAVNGCIRGILRVGRTLGQGVCYHVHGLCESFWV
mmetsp:Transcript_29655/g.76065  ORF Transcript_29655/g.76065 Transcript_29655/m.76065 type:complete len:107 (+) Transcript_29655:463-783(+)